MSPTTGISSGTALQENKSGSAEQRWSTRLQIGVLRCSVEPTAPLRQSATFGIETKIQGGKRYPGRPLHLPCPTSICSLQAAHPENPVSVVDSRQDLAALDPKILIRTESRRHAPTVLLRLHPC